MTIPPEPPAIDGVVFDLDGVLVDSERLYLSAWYVVAKELGCPEIVSIYPQLIGLPYEKVEALIRDNLPPEIPLQTFLSAGQVALEPILADGYPLKAGAMEILEFLEARGMPCALATSSTTSVPEKLQRNAIDGYFQAVVTRDDVAHGKPHPDIYLAAAERLQVAPDRCLAVEDSKPGLLSAQAAGFRVVHVPDIAVIEAAVTDNCTAVFPNLLALRDWLTQKV